MVSTFYLLKRLSLLCNTQKRILSANVKYKHKPITPEREEVTITLTTESISDHECL